jgi:general stress protein CsbA
MIDVLFFLFVSWLIFINARRRGGPVVPNLIHGTFIFLLYSAYFSIVECLWFLRLAARSEWNEAWRYITFDAGTNQLVTAIARGTAWVADLVAICLAGALAARMSYARWIAVVLSVPLLLIYSVRSGLLYSAWVESFTMSSLLRGSILYILLFGWFYFLAVWFYRSQLSSELFSPRTKASKSQSDSRDPSAIR